MTLEQFLAGHEDSAMIFDALRLAIAAIGQARLEVHLSKSQVAFRRRRPFAWAWVPGQYLRGQHAPLVLTVALRRRDPSPRWKEVIEPAAGRFVHHLELHSTIEIDDQVRAWLQEAWLLAG